MMLEKKKDAKEADMWGHQKMVNNVRQNGQKWHIGKKLETKV